MQAGLACLGNLGQDGMKVDAPSGKETFDDTKPTEAAQAPKDPREDA